MVKYTQLTTIMILKASANPNDGFACLSTAVVFLVACIFLHVNLCIMIWKRRKNISINQILNSQKTYPCTPKSDYKEPAYNELSFIRN